MWNTILFDLDGTLTDPKQGITTAVGIALEHFGIHESPDNLTRFIGPPLMEAFPEFYGFTTAQAEEAIQVFQEYFGRQGWRENNPYEGIAEFLGGLKSAGKRLIVATSKPEVFARRILDHFDLSQYFFAVCGAPLDERKGAEKIKIIRKALAFCEDTPIMVGDRKHDIEAAHALGLRAIGVLYGYGSREELTGCGADYLAEDLSALQTLLY
ncbi:MAG: HAD-IA family hydrolase [Oscillospiraceae bacterium]|nr:HAD-IA family hydrolase [Oscillospiraceae bacterium]